MEIVLTQTDIPMAQEKAMLTPVWSIVFAMFGVAIKLAHPNMTNKQVPMSSLRNTAMILRNLPTSNGDENSGSSTRKVKSDRLPGREKINIEWR